MYYSLCLIVRHTISVPVNILDLRYGPPLSLESHRKTKMGGSVKKLSLKSIMCTLMLNQFVVLNFHQNVVTRSGISCVGKCLAGSDVMPFTARSLET